MPRRLTFFSMAIAGLLLATPAAAVNCTDAESCSQALQQLQSKLKDNKQQVVRSQQAANNYGSALQELGGQLQTTQKKINETQTQVASVSDNIQEINKQIADDDAQIERLREQIRQDIVLMYEASRVSNFTFLFSDSSFSQKTAEINNLATIQRDIQEKVALTKSLQADLEAKKADLQHKKDDLTIVSDNLSGYKKDLSVQTNQTNRLLNATKTQIQSYVADQAVIKKQIAETQQKLANLIQQSHWGNDIASAPAMGWTYSQLNYYQTLGDSPYTVHDYGCLVTSLAMVSSFYGNHVTPAQIANNSGYFDRGGYARVASIVGHLGLSIQEHSGVNWATVDEQLKEGHPVIVSIYLPQVGAINSDGSSHFIVLQAKSGNTYLMQDPLGPGRSYGLSNVRSMYVLSN